MYKSVSIQNNVLEQMTAVFSSTTQETGFLLGCSSRLDYLDCCEQLSAIRAGLHFYEPDPAFANKIIKCWASQEICFCGLIHSHVVDKETLSEADIEFAKQLFFAYKLPVLWFGLALVKENEVHYQFYSITNDSIDRINSKEAITCFGLSF